MSVARPKLRGLLADSLKRNFTIAVGLSVLSPLAYYVGVIIPRETAYETFYKNYNPQVEFERMKAAGIFKSVRPDGSVGDGW